jgi:hypothetical protein
MITVPTQRLYYKRFTHCLKFHITSERVSVDRNTTIAAIKSRVAASGVPHRTRVDWHFTGKTTMKIVLSVYLSDVNCYDDLLASEHGSLATWTSKPASALHTELLLNKTEILIRDHLLYKRFRYRVNLRIGWSKEYLGEINTWIANNFQDRVHGRKGDYMLTGSWTLSLYLIDEMDLTLVRLCIGERITDVTRVDTFAEHGITDGTMLAGDPPED